jgi:hypothetical protein
LTIAPQAAEQLSKALGQEITHKKLSVAAYRDFLIEIGYPGELATTLAEANRLVAGGSEEMIYTAPGRIVGKVTFAAFCEANKAALSTPLVTNFGHKMWARM